MCMDDKFAQLMDLVKRVTLTQFIKFLLIYPKCG
jgi:hypothetical protein